ncbi:hypothetical protein LTR08_001429 [Meristemomyces frigidus]|nr:hypothetical protein LTR08_001429 [Meristemomyces frigidus]
MIKKMGANSSKQAKEDSKDGKRSPSQEKHASADSTTPLAANAAQLAFPQTPVVDKHVSFEEKSLLGRSRTKTLSTGGSNTGDTDTIVTIPRANSPTPLKIHVLDGHSNVSRPPPPPRLRHLSELIDPMDLATADGHVRSPSGNMLEPAQWLVHPDRPMSIRERQERIQERMRAASRLGEVESAGEEVGKGGKKGEKAAKKTKMMVEREKTAKAAAKEEKKKAKAAKNGKKQLPPAATGTMASAMKGSGQVVGQLPVFECTYDNCIKRFNSEKEMIGHKLSEPEHNYCKKCKYDASSWEDLTQHKVGKMAEFLADRNRAEGASPKHITCEFCGADSKSFGGRKAHRAQMHPAEQTLYCPAKDQVCGAIFTRAAFMIQHLEEGLCQYITAYEFRASVQHKHVLKEIMLNPDVFAANLQINKKFAVAVDPGLITEGEETETQDHDEGGVQILDQEDDEQKGGHPAMEAERDLIDLEAAYPQATRSTLETWPRLPAQMRPQLTEEALQNLRLESPRGSTIMNDSEYGSSATSRRNGKKVRTESYPSLNSSINNSSVNSVSARSEISDTASDATVTSPYGQPAWSNGHSTAKIKSALKKATPTPTPVAAGDYEALLVRREDEILASKPKSNNMLYSHFYDPGSPDYDPDLFLSSVTLRYCCPFPGCADNESTYDSPSDIAAHLQHAHLRHNYVCTTCYKRFKTATSLTAHMESTGRCRVKDSNNYKTLLDEITGGFLKGRIVLQPTIYKAEESLVKAGQKAPLKGVMLVEFKEKMPDQR